MFQSRHLRTSMLTGIIALVAGASVALGEPSTAFSYQGQLREAGAPKTGVFDMRFTLFDAPAGGTALSATMNVQGIVVSGGVFGTTLDFGFSAAPGAPALFGNGGRYLQVEVSPSGAGAFTALSPRQQIASVPSALSVGPLSAISQSGADQSININSSISFISGGVFEQTFKVQSSCWLGASAYTGFISVSYGIGDPNCSAHFDILDDGGNVIATAPDFTYTFPEAGVAYPLLQWPSPVLLQPGRIYRFRAQCSPTLRPFITSNVYPGGSLFVNGVEDPAHDLSFNLPLNSSSTLLRSDSPLGLGTNPAAMLHVIGDAIVSNRLGVGKAPQQALDVVGDSSLFGNVRIATTESDARLNVAGDGTLAAFVGGGTALLRLRAAGAAQSIRNAYLGYDNNQTAVLTLANQYGSGDINIKPAPGGRVGIGPNIGTTPNAGLEVSNDVPQATITTKGSNSWGTWVNLLGPARNFALANGGSLGQMWQGALGIRDLTAGVNRIVISPNGNVTIGNEYPSNSALFNVNAFGPTEVSIGANNGGSGNGTLLSLRTTAQQGGECQIQGISRAGFEYGTLVLNPEGGTVAKPGGGTFANYCDRTLKQDIVPMHGTLDRLLSLRGYSFRYTDAAVEKKHMLTGTQLGVMAQDVQQVFPDWVSTDNEGKLMVTERATTALMVEALRDLRTEKDAQIEAQRKEIDTLRATNAALETRLERLEKAMSGVGAGSR
ncbi:MAG: tail fiber domain-containing protein [Phycisphaerales bacterium]